MELIVENKSSPKGGYGFDAKELYRYRVWSHFSKSLVDKHDNQFEEVNVAFMPSKEGLEIEIALSFGFREENLYAIDRDDNFLSKSNWFKKYPKVNLIHSEVKDAGYIIKKKGVNLTFANLDLCGNISIPTVDAISGFVDSGVMCKQSKLAITLLNGRENSMEGMLLLKLFAKNNNDKIDRIEIISKLCLTSGNNNFIVEETNKYTTTSGKTMSWGIVVLNSSFEKPKTKQEIKLEPNCGKSSVRNTITINGKVNTIRNILKVNNIPENTFRSRITLGWTPEKAATKKVSLSSRKYAMKRKRFDHKVKYAFDGKNLTITEWASISGFSHQTLRKRMDEGLTLSEAVTKPNILTKACYKPVQQ